MNPKTVLLLGGPKHMELIAVDERRADVPVALMPDEANTLVSDPSQPIEDITMQTIVYRDRQWFGSDCIWVVQNLDDRPALEMLFASLSKPPTRRGLMSKTEAVNAIRQELHERDRLERQLDEYRPERMAARIGCSMEELHHLMHEARRRS